MTTKIKFPVRINHYLAIHNYASRREADVLIAKGLVKINGKKASLGDKVFEGDKVEVKNSQKLKDNKYYVYYKPKEIITHSPQGSEKSIKEVAGFPKDFFPVGRLDKDSQGIIIMTNDGRITGKLLDPDSGHEKEYRVKVNKDISHLFVKLMTSGIKLEDFKTKPAIVKKIDERIFDIVLTEGKKHQIRRMCAALGYQVRDLKRIRIMNVKIGNLKRGQKRELQGAELNDFLKKLGLEK